MLNTVLFGPMLIILLLLHCFFAKKVIGTLINFVSIFNVMWIGLAFLALWRFYGLYQPTAITYLIVILTSSIYTVVSLGIYSGVYHANKVDLSEGDDERIAVLSQRKIRILELATFFAILWMLQYVVRMIPMIIVGDWTLARLHYLQSDIYSGIYTTRKILMNQWVVYPIINVATIVSAYYVACLKPKYRLIALSSIGQIMIVISTAGRSALFKMVVYYVLAYVLLSKRRFGLLQRIKKSSKLVKFALVVGFVGLIFITTQRQVGGNSTIMENILVYFLGPFIYLSNILANPVQFGLTNDFLFGKATFGFITTPLEILGSMLLGYDYAGVDNIITSYVSTYLPLSDKVKGNAVSTMLYPFMKDYSVYGFWIGVVIFAAITAICFAKAKKAVFNKVFWNCMSIFMLYAVFFSEWEYELLFPASFTTMFLMYFFLSKKRIRFNAK